MTPHNLIGQRFGHLTVLSSDGTPGKREKWLCQCDCGNARSLRATSVLSGAMRSCGCQTSRRRSYELHDQRRFDLADARKQLSAAQLALTDAIHGLDAEEIASARHAFTEALKRVRGFTTRAGLYRADSGKGAP
jgi:hypothetical protein